jgi:hypothetical protein
MKARKQRFQWHLVISLSLMEWRYSIMSERLKPSFKRWNLINQNEPVVNDKTILFDGIIVCYDWIHGAIFIEVCRRDFDWSFKSRFEKRILASISCHDVDITIMIQIGRF